MRFAVPHVCIKHLCVTLQDEVAAMDEALSANISTQLPKPVLSGDDLIDDEDDDEADDSALDQAEVTEYIKALQALDLSAAGTGTEQISAVGSCRR